SIGFRLEGLAAAVWTRDDYQRHCRRFLLAAGKGVSPDLAYFFVADDVGDAVLDDLDLRHAFELCLDHFGQFLEYVLASDRLALEACDLEHILHSRQWQTG